MEIREKPYNLFLLTSAFVGVVTFILIFSDKSVDIQYHDTYFVIAQCHYNFIFSVLFLLFWLMYKALYRILYSLALTRTHVFVTLICFILYFSLDIHLSYNTFQARSYTIDTIQAFKYFNYLNTFYNAFIIILLLTQIIFVLNLLFGISKYLISKEK